MPLPRFAKLTEDRRTAILDAALGEFAEHGYAAASFNRIIEQLETSKGAIYYYFSDKEDLYLTVLEWVFAQLRREVRLPGRARDAEAFWREIAELYRSLLALVVRDLRIVRMAQKSASELARLDDAGRLRPILQGVSEAAARLVAQGRRLGAVRTDMPAELLTELVLAVGPVLDHHMLAQGRLEHAEVRERAALLGVDLFRRMLEPREGTARRRNASKRAPSTR